MMFGIIFVFKLLSIILLVNVIYVTSTSEAECDSNEQVLICKQQNLKLQLENTNLNLEIVRLREENRNLLNEKVNCTAFAENVDGISLSLRNIQDDLEPLKKHFTETFIVNRNNTEIQPKTSIENHTFLSEWKDIKENLTAVASQISTESLETLLQELKGDEDNWLDVLRRIDGSVDFDRSWHDYREGFGNIEGNFFIGLENLYQLTAFQCHELMVVLLDFDNVQKYAKYDRFRIGSEAQHYDLNILGNYSGTAGDALRDSQSMKFTTYNRDNDNHVDDNCAKIFKGGWWHNHCGSSKLTGVYQPFSRDIFFSGIEWQTWRLYYSFKFAKMMLRPTSC